MQYLKQVAEYPDTLASSVTGVRVIPMKLTEDGTFECSADDPEVGSFVVFAEHGTYRNQVVAYPILPFARELWLARTLALAAAAQMSMRFNVLVQEMQ